MKTVKSSAIRGGFVKALAQVWTFGLRIGSLMVMGRLLEPADFGIVGMVTAITGVLGLFRDFGLSAAAIQRPSISDEEASDLFWINVAIGTALGVICAGMAPVIALFYGEPRLAWITAALAASFVANGAGVQHSVQLQREMRYAAMAVAEVIALVAATGLSIAAAMAGWGYWALVVMAVALPVGSTIGFWAATGWVPRRPTFHSGLGATMKFGGTVTLNGLIMYVAYNLDKALLGKFWGADVLGIYGRAYQLINIPTENLNTAVGGVAFSSLSRLQDSPELMKRYFLKGYSLVLALTLPITFSSALLADDLIAVILGPKWSSAAALFRLLSPTIVIFALINPLVWLLFAKGLVQRSLNISFVLGPLVILGYVIGLPYGPEGVAIGYSLTMTLWVLPHILWCIRGTGISLRDIGEAVKGPFLSALVSAPIPMLLHAAWPGSLPQQPVFRLGLCAALYGCGYAGMLLFAMGQKAFYLDLFRGLRVPAPRPGIAEA